MQSYVLPPLWVDAGRLGVEPIQTTSLHHQVQAYLLRATYEGRLSPSDRLNETGIASQLGVSRTPVREALTYLESTGLVVRHPRRGFFLASLSARDAEHCYAVRQLLEGHAARQVAGRLTGEQIETLQAVINAMGDAAEAGSWPQAAGHNIAFHETVVGIAGNPVLLRMWQSVGPALWYFDSLTRRIIDAGAKDGFVRRHRVLLAALRRGDPAGAEAAFVSHIADVRRVVVRRLQTVPVNKRGEGQ
jgi:DNA-binding GntR family transcriptional regulator